FHRELPDRLKEGNSSLELDDEFPQKHADGAFSADEMTNDIGRADNTILSARILFSQVVFRHDRSVSDEELSCRCPTSTTDSTKYYNGTKETEVERTRSTMCKRFN